MSVVLRAKLIVVGDAAVGKSALTQVFHSDGSHFPKGYSMTIGQEICVKSVSLPETSDTVELFIYDSAGKEMFADYAAQFWDHPSAVMVVFDVNNEKSFHSCLKWFERVKNKSNQHIPAVLVGNKTDLMDRRIVTTESAKSFAQGNGMEYFECSAKSQENVEAPFKFLAETFRKMYYERLEVMKSLAA
ncbi:intraflagellar transport protein 27 homolog [Apostichopus japonicus]|uniref:intraflagellar transport protein 27 homolog n=1 Tax=Stichopus japonicus TaxID=307972 RepID=UPI003AB7DD44